MEEDKNIESPSVSEIIKPTPTPVNPIKPASKFSIKAIIGTIIFLLLAGGAAAGYVYREPIMSFVSKPTPTPIAAQTSPTPTPDPTANWKTYTNTSYNFSFKYPSSFIIEKEDKQVFKSTNLDKESVTIYQYNLQFTNGKMVQNDPQYPPSKDSSYLGINIEPTKGKTITDLYDNKETGFGTTKVTLLDKTGDADEIATITNIENVIRIYRKGNYLVSFTSSQDGPGELDKYREQIFSTFKFTDPSSFVTPDWKLYTNKQYNFTILYPSEWTAATHEFAVTFSPPLPKEYSDLTIRVDKKTSYDDKTADDLEDYATNYAKWETGPSGEVSQISKILGGSDQIGYLVEWKGNAWTSNEKTYTAYFDVPTDNTRVVRIDCGKDKLLSTCKKMLASFQFTNQ